MAALQSILSTFTLAEQPHEIHRERGQRRWFLKNALASPFEKFRAAWRHDIGVQILADVDVSCRVLNRQIPWIPQAESLAGTTLPHSGSV